MVSGRRSLLAALKACPAEQAFTADMHAQERGQPVQPPKKPKAAPFFLPTVPGLGGDPRFDVTAGSAPDDQALENGHGKTKENGARVQRVDRPTDDVRYLHCSTVMGHARSA